MIELFVFLQMGGQLEDVEVVVLAESAQERREIVEDFGAFDARNAKCFDPADKSRLLSMVEAGHGRSARGGGGACTYPGRVTPEVRSFVHPQL